MSGAKTNIGIDGYTREANKDKEISLVAAQLFATESGQSFLKYLKSITIQQVHGPNVTTEELRHIEGQRYIVALIESRINHAHKVKKNV
jgi:hypothetical protein|tara:strand:+ start:1793 stop:2059 length:267 start_codon:yes stop_codon:yes gene_type:complete